MTGTRLMTGLMPAVNTLAVFPRLLRAAGAATQKMPINRQAHADNHIPAPSASPVSSIGRTA